MIKVLSIVPYKIFPAKVGGQKGIALFNEYLAREVELVCVTVKANDPEYAKGYTLLNVLSDSKYRYINLLYFFTVRNLVRRHGITHIILEHPYFGWLGILIKKLTGVKLVVHSHNIEADRWKSLGKWWWKILRWYESVTHSHADYNFFIHDNDREYALSAFGLKPSRCTTITYGIEAERPPRAAENLRCNAVLKNQFAIPGNDVIFLFNGTLDYKPNHNAVRHIIESINPNIPADEFGYKIIICGRSLPQDIGDLIAKAGKNIIYAGFVDDITVYFKGADVFINPVVDGGGIKTKLVEALGYNVKAVSTQNGSIGIIPEDAGPQLIVVPDGNWALFAAKMIEAARQPAYNTPDVFYKKFYWGHIAEKAAAFIQ